MKNILLLIIFIVAFATNLIAQNPLVKKWDKRFGGAKNDVLYSLMQTGDRGYILGGWSESDISGDKTQPSRGNYDYWILKLDSLSNKQWDKRFGGSSDDWFFSIQQTNDAGYVLGGTSYSGIGGDKTQPSWGLWDYWLVKVDSLGTKQWDKRFGGTGDDFLYSVQQTSDGGYILGGYTSTGISGNKTQPSWGGWDYWILKVDSLGMKLWDKRFGGVDDDFLYSLQQTKDGGYILGGYSHSGLNGDKTQPSRGYNDYWIIKVDSLGLKQWDKRFGGTYYDQLYSLTQTSDEGYILGGWSASGIGGDKTQSNLGIDDYWVVKIDSQGTKLWDRRFGGSDYDNGTGNISQTDDGGYLLAGSSNSPISGDKTENNLGPVQTWIVKTDSLGNKQWDKTVLTLGHDAVGFAIQTKDGCFAMANWTNVGIGGDKTQATQGIADYWVIKFCDSTLAIPRVNLTASDRIICENQMVDFFDMSLDNPTSWHWYFTGAQPVTSTLQNPVDIYYPIYGQFDVSLKACNANGCDSVSFPHFITELQNPSVPSVTVNGKILCTSPAQSYSWHESTNLSVLLSTSACYKAILPGNYFVVISDSNGCKATSPSVTMQSTEDSNCELWLNGTHLNFYGNCITDAEARLYIYDDQGKEIYSSLILSSGVNLPLTINGIYFYRVVSHGVTSQGKFSFQNRMD